MFSLLQYRCQEQAIRAMLGKFLCVTYQAIISNQLLIVARTIVGDGVWRTGVVAARKQNGFSVVWQPVWELFDIAYMCTHHFSSY
jgi:hypothetical protein